MRRANVFATWPTVSRPRCRGRRSTGAIPRSSSGRELGGATRRIPRASGRSARHARRGAARQARATWRPTACQAVAARLADGIASLCGRSTGACARRAAPRRRDRSRAEHRARGLAGRASRPAGSMLTARPAPSCTRGSSGLIWIIVSPSALATRPRERGAPSFGIDPQLEVCAVHASPRASPRARAARRAVHRHHHARRGRRRAPRRSIGLRRGGRASSVHRKQASEHRRRGRPRPGPEADARPPAPRPARAAGAMRASIAVHTRVGRRRPAATRFGERRERVLPPPRSRSRSRGRRASSPRSAGAPPAQRAEHVFARRAPARAAGDEAHQPRSAAP